jgi:hypothetical protein
VSGLTLAVTLTEDQLRTLQMALGTEASLLRRHIAGGPDWPWPSAEADLQKVIDVKNALHAALAAAADRAPHSVLEAIT